MSERLYFECRAQIDAANARGWYDVADLFWQILVTWKLDTRALLDATPQPPRAGDARRGTMMKP